MWIAHAYDRVKYRRIDFRQNFKGDFLGILAVKLNFEPTFVQKEIQENLWHASPFILQKLDLGDQLSRMGIRIESTTEEKQL